ncbi:MAG: hypothetical protein WAW73_11670 [Rhodoferax sp.]|jgi:ElaB/YqjD/DUF883 family membrane-anchored ribosome-binding protein
MSNNLIDQAVQSADYAIRSTQHAGEQASALVRHGMDAASDSAHQAGDRTVAYIRHEPVKSMLIAAAAGAALAVLATVLGKSGKSR